MNKDDLSPISPERWRSKFTSEPNEIIPAPREVPGILQQLLAGKLSPTDAEARLVKLGFLAREAQLMVEDHLGDESRSKDAKGQ
jgi:hypothetical protein